MRRPCLDDQEDQGTPRSRNLSATLLLLLLLPRPAVALELDENSFRARKLGIQWEVPEGWALHRETGYPPVLAVLLHRQGPASISLAIGPLGSGDGMLKFIEDNRVGMTAVGLKTTTPRRSSIAGRQVWLLEAQTKDRKTATRQLYIKHAERSIIITLVAPAAQLKTYLWDLTQAVDALQLERPNAMPGNNEAGAAGEASSRAQPTSQPTSSPASLPVTTPLEDPTLDSPSLDAPATEDEKP